MPKFKVFVSFEGQGVYTVEAKNAREAEENYASDNIDYQELQETFTNEEIIDVQKICDICNDPEDDDGRCGCTNNDAN